MMRHPGELAAISVGLSPSVQVPISDGIGKTLHGMLFFLLEEIDPSMSDALHNIHGVRPFTISMLHGHGCRAGSVDVARPDQAYYVRFTALDYRLAYALTSALDNQFRSGHPIQLGGELWKMVDIGQGDEMGQASFADLVHTATSEPQVTLRWTTPTAIRQGQTHLLFPLPLPTFAGLVDKWRRFSPIPLPEDILDWIGANVVAEAHRLETQAVCFRRHQVHGFTGWCRFRVLSPDKGHIQALQALANFAFYAGTGSKTTMGMGQTRVVG